MILEGAGNAGVKLDLRLSVIETFKLTENFLGV